jgi:hypothetical protein
VILYGFYKLQLKALKGVRIIFCTQALGKIEKLIDLPSVCTKLLGSSCGFAM